MRPAGGGERGRAATGGHVAKETFGARLRRLREAAGLTQLGLAERSGKSEYTVVKLEADRHRPTWVTVVALARALGCSTAAFDTAEVPAEAREPGEPPQEEPPARPKRRKKN